MKYRDIRSLGRSVLVPKKHGETASERHERRLNANLQRERCVRDWCVKRAVQLSITNNGHHWKFSKDGFRGLVAIQCETSFPTAMGSRHSCP